MYYLHIFIFYIYFLFTYISFHVTIFPVIKNKLLILGDENQGYYNQTIKVQDVNVDFVTTYVHSGNNVYRTSYGVCKYTANIIVSNNSYHKTIVMHHQTWDGSWRDSDKATYVKSLGNGKELWTLSGYIDSPAQFVFNYKESNAWDNNNGRNYTLADFR